MHTDAPNPHAPPPGTPTSGTNQADASFFGTTLPVPAPGQPRRAGVPRVDIVRPTEPDHRRRAALERTRGRLVITASGFGLLFVALLAKLALATVITPLTPHRPDPSLTAIVAAVEQHGGAFGANPATASAPADIHLARATITDRNGEILAVSLPTAALYANPREMINVADAAHKLKQAVPKLDEAQVATRLGTERQFVYLARQLTPAEQLRVNTLGIPGVYFEAQGKRRYPMGRMAAQVLGGVDIDGHGIAGVERFFDQRLRDQPADKLRLSLDARVQAVVREEIAAAMTTFGAIGACGIVMDVRTGEVLAMVSLPDYDANLAGQASADERFNRAVTGMYEPGSTFKLQTAAMALDSGVAQIWSVYDAIHPIEVGRFEITDFQGKHRMLELPEVLAYSSNLGAARIAESVGADRQRDWLRTMGMFSRVGVELPEEGLPIAQPAKSWKEIVTMTVGFGHGIAISPLHVVRGTAVLANGGEFLRPTLLARAPDQAPAESTPIMQRSTSDTLRKLMRLVVTQGYGKPAEVPGYYVGGKTGTAEKVGAHGYKKHTNVAAFISVFPMQAPRYAVYMMLDEPHATAATHGYATAAWVAAPAAGRVIARIGPMLGLLPDTVDAPRIEQALAIPLQPGRPPGVRAAPTAPPAAAAMPTTPRPVAGPAAPHPSPRDSRREAKAGRSLPVQTVAAQTVAAQTVAAR